MKIRHLMFVLAAAGCLAFAALARADQHNSGTLNVHNNTGHEVLAFLFLDGQVHLNEAGGTRFADLKNGQSAVAHVARSPFSILLVDHNDVWHAEFHDFHATDMTFLATTNHATKSGH